MSSTDFKKLIVWQKSKDLAVDIYKLTSAGNLAKDYSLVDQMRRAAVSISSNIAEGNDRGTEKELIKYSYISKGSLSELLTQLEIAKEIGYIDEEKYLELDTKCTEISKMLGGLIKSLSKKFGD